MNISQNGFKSPGGCPSIFFPALRSILCLFLYFLHVHSLLQLSSLFPQSFVLCLNTSCCVIHPFHSNQCQPCFRNLFPVYIHRFPSRLLSSILASSAASRLFHFPSLFPCCFCAVPASQLRLCCSYLCAPSMRFQWSICHQSHFV